MTKVQVKVIGFQPTLIITSLFIVIMFGLGLGVILAAGSSEVTHSIWFIAGFFFLSLLIFPFVIMRVGANKLRHKLVELFKEFEK